jgi:hypothetical protein
VQFSDVDVFAEVGALKPLVKEFVYTPKGKTMTIELVAKTDNALINGIEIFSATGTSTDTSPTSGPGAFEGTPVKVTVPPGTTACVASGSLLQPAGSITISPQTVSFGEVDPANVQGNFQPLTLANAGASPVGITAISCVALTNKDTTTIPFFVVQFGGTGSAARVTCAPPAC